jgi:glycosyltransferase involved in cell wall biosynthesis
MVEAKGHAELMEMFETVGEQHPDAVLVLVGDGPYREPLLDAIASHPYGDRILAPGARQDVAAFLAMADVFVHASLTEAFGLVILEAMAAGLPVVAFELPAYADFVVAGASADLVPLGDVAALTDATSALLDDPVRAARLGSFGRALAQEHHPPDAVARSFESIYAEVLSLPTRASRLLATVV